MSSVYIKTYGCQMNERDSEQVAAMFLAGGYSFANSELEADVVLINTCSVREKAELKALGKMGMLCSQSVDRPWVVFGFMGCMVQSKARELFETVPRLDVVTGTHCYHRVFPLCDSLLKQRLASAVHSPLRKGAQLCEVEDLPDAHNRIRDHLPARTSCSAFVRSAVVRRRIFWMKCAAWLTAE